MHLKDNVATSNGGSLYNNGTMTLDLWSADWKIAAGHRIGVAQHGHHLAHDGVVVAALERAERLVP